MIKTFKSVTPYLKFKPKRVSIDNFAFQLHYRWTFVILIIATILVTSRQYIGEHIKCITDAIPEHVINTYCFFTPTYTVTKLMNETALKKGVAIHPGVGPVNSKNSADATDWPSIKRHAYYQWVPFVLFGQALMFYIPHGLWKIWEGGRIFSLVNGLKMVGLSRYIEKDNIKIGNDSIPSKTATNIRVQDIKNAFRDRLKLNRQWGFKLVLCEILNFVNIFLNIIVTNKFLGGQFMSLGQRFWREDFNGEMDALDVVFPKVTKCDFYKYGASGSLQKHDTLCVMALNVINEKIYVVLWFWFLFVFIMSILALIWRAFTLCLYQNKTFNSFVFNIACPGRMNARDLHIVTKRCNFANWMFLFFLANNMAGFLFRQVLHHIAVEFDLHPREDNENEVNTLRMSKANAQEGEVTGFKNIDEVDGTPLIKEKVK